jgi:hypothetical protein
MIPELVDEHDDFHQELPKAAANEKEKEVKTT